MKEGWDQHLWAHPKKYVEFVSCPRPKKDRPHGGCGGGRQTPRPKWVGGHTHGTPHMPRRGEGEPKPFKSVKGGEGVAIKPPGQRHKRGGQPEGHLRNFKKQKPTDRPTEKTKDRRKNGGKEAG